MTEIPALKPQETAATHVVQTGPSVAASMNSEVKMASWRVTCRAGSHSRYAGCCRHSAGALPRTEKHVEQRVQDEGNDDPEHGRPTTHEHHDEDDHR